MEKLRRDVSDKGISDKEIERRTYQIRKFWTVMLREGTYQVG